MSVGRAEREAMVLDNAVLREGAGTMSGAAERGSGAGTLARRLALGIALGATLLVGGCSVLGGGSTPTDTFDLTAPREVAAPRGSALQILVPEPATDRAVDTDRIVVRPSATEINYFAGAQWSDRLPRLVQSRLIEAFENSKRFRAAGRPGQGLLIDYQVVGEIRAFEYDAAAKVARVEFSVKLMNDKTGRVVATSVFKAETPVAGDSARTAVAGFDAALADVLRQVVGWTATNAGR